MLAALSQPSCTASGTFSMRYVSPSSSRDGCSLAVHFEYVSNSWETFSSNHQFKPPVQTISSDHQFKQPRVRKHDLGLNARTAASIGIRLNPAVDTNVQYIYCVCMVILYIWHTAFRYLQVVMLGCCECSASVVHQTIRANVARM